MTELKPCPFCGGKELHVYVVDIWRTRAEAVRCEVCEFDGPKGGDTKQAAEKWNRREGDKS